MSKEEQRVVVKFLIKLGDGGGNILKKLRMVYGDGTLKVTAVYKWVARYKEGWESLEDHPCSGRPVLTHNDENMKRVDELLATNRQISNRHIAETLEINKGGSSYAKTVFASRTEVINCRTKTMSAWCRHCLFEQCAADPNFLNRVITGDESWFFKYDPSNQHANKVYVKEGELNQLTPLRSCSNNKSMLILFFNDTG